jgi:hypothetical protein
VIADAIGAALGVAAALALVVGFLKYSVGEEFGFITAHVTVQWLIVSYCLGVVITFLTVVIASMKVSSVNIVAAIRGIDEEGERERKRATNWKWVAIGVPSLIVPPLGVWFLLRKGFGLAWAWICAPLASRWAHWRSWRRAAALTFRGRRDSNSDRRFWRTITLVPLTPFMNHRVPFRICVIGLFVAPYRRIPTRHANLGSKMAARTILCGAAGLVAWHSVQRMRPDWDGDAGLSHRTL